MNGPSERAAVDNASGAGERGGTPGFTGGVITGAGVLGWLAVTWAIGLAFALALVLLTFSHSTTTEV
eukprot:3645401-Amphidinium_carterae.1